MLEYLFVREHAVVNPYLVQLALEVSPVLRGLEPHEERRSTGTDHTGGGESRSGWQAVDVKSERRSIELPAGWKASIAIQLVSEWAENKTVLPNVVLDAAEGVFKAILERFDE